VFTVNRNNTGTTQWAGGFVCLKGVNPDSEPSVIINATTRSVAWREIVN
jgi:hypothetical protein